MTFSLDGCIAYLSRHSGLAGFAAPRNDAINLPPGRPSSVSPFRVDAEQVEQPPAGND